jgi:hypothetical protein
MSLASDLDELFADEDETIIIEPLRFKAQLGIGERAYALLRAREHLTTFTEALGVGATASAAAGSSVVASTFFTSGGVLGWLGIGAATTPIGWILAAGVASGAAYVGVSRFFERSKDKHLVVIPKFINTPLDMIAAALFELMLPVSLKIASSDGELCDPEKRALHDYYVDEWGYNPGFLDRMIDEYQTNLDEVSFARLAKSLEEYCQSNPVCDPKIIMDGFVTHIREVTEANGSIDEQELQRLNYLTQLMTPAAEKSQASQVIDAATSTVVRGYETTSEAAVAGVKSTGQLLKTGAEKTSAYSGVAAGKAVQGVKATAEMAGKLTESVSIDRGKLKSFFSRKPKQEGEK